MKTFLRNLLLSLVGLSLLLAAARAGSTTYSITGTGTSSDVPGISIPTNATVYTSISISTSGSVYSGSAGAILTYNHAPYVTYHVLGLSGPSVSQSWTDYVTADTYRLQQFCSLPSPAVGTVSVTISW